MTSIKKKVIDARLRGLTYSQITEEFGVAKSTAQGWMNAFYNGDSSDVNDNQLTLGFVNENLQRVKPERFQKTENEVLAFLENLAPIELGCSLPKPSISDSDFVVVMGDMHFPLHCQRSIDIVLETVSQLKPKEIILNGDTVDMLAVSRFPKDIRFSHSLAKEREEYQKFLVDLISASNGVPIYETHSNHSGNGTDGRWFRYLSERLSDLKDMPDVLEKLSYENVFLGDELSKYVVHTDYVQLCEDLVVLHGDVVRKNGGYSARGMLEKYYQSLIMGHTHRMGMTAQRIPGIGSRTESQIYVWEMGCLCDLSPIYASAPNWQNGFGIVVMDGNSFGIEPVMINDGVATIATLGKTIKA